jgi:hypothetical protein
MPCPFNKFDYMQVLCDYLCACEDLCVPVNLYFHFGGVIPVIKSMLGPP